MRQTNCSEKAINTVKNEDKLNSLCENIQEIRIKELSRRHRRRSNQISNKIMEIKDIKAVYFVGAGGIGNQRHRQILPQQRSWL